MQVEVNDKVRHILAVNRIFSTNHGGSNYRDGEVLRFREDAYVEPYSLILGGMVIPSINSFSYTWSELPEETTIGRYCSISWKVEVMFYNHPLDRVSTSSFTYDPECVIFSKHLDDFNVAGFSHKAVIDTRSGRRGAPSIGNDVWIGQGTMLARGITLGDGCVVGAASVVTKSVPPFAIVGGNPARIIRYRFDEKIIERLLRTRWWSYKFSDFVGMTIDDVPRFLDELEENIAQGRISPYAPPKLRLASLLAK